MPRHSAGEITTPSSVDDDDTLAPKSYVAVHSIDTAEASEDGLSIVFKRGDGGTAGTVAFPASGAVSAVLLGAAANPDQLAVGTITRSGTGAAVGFSVSWPDGAIGTFTGTESTAIPGAIDAYTVTHILSGDTITYTQPALTRDGTGAVTNRPALVVS